jgi:hypothetical protein
MPDYPDGMNGYVCEAFPNEELPIDSFIVGLIRCGGALTGMALNVTCMRTRAGCGYFVR